MRLLLQAQLEKPNPSDPDKGKVSIFVDCSPTAEPTFERRLGINLSYTAFILRRVLVECAHALFDIMLQCNIAIWKFIIKDIVGRKRIDKERLNLILFCSCPAQMLLDSIPWAAWVPYASALLGVLLTLANPCIQCIVSRQVGPYE